MRKWHCEACNSVAALRCCLDLEITFSKVLVVVFLWLLQMQPIRFKNLKNCFFSFLSAFFLTSHTSHCDGLFFRISPLLTSWSSVLVLSRSWTRYHQSWEFLGLGWNEHHYGMGFTFLHFCFLWGCSGTRDCLLLWCSIKNMQPGGMRTKKPPRVALCMVLVVTADNLLINKAKNPLQTTCKSR